MSVQAGGPMCSLSNVWIGFWHLCGQQATASLTALNLFRVWTQSGSGSGIALLSSVLSLILYGPHRSFVFQTLTCNSCVSFRPPLPVLGVTLEKSGWTYERRFCWSMLKRQYRENNRDSNSNKNTDPDLNGNITMVWMETMTRVGNTG